MYQPSINIHHNINDLNQALASRWSSLAHQAIQERGSFHVALAGGSTPKQLYKKLASTEIASSLPWQKTHIYFGDERCVPPNHKESNFLMAKLSLLDHVPLAEQNIHRIKGENPDHHKAANDYQKIMEKHLPHDNNSVQFDLILLGLGPDGHIASLFPDTSIINIRDHLAAAVYIEKFDSWRISITFPVIEQARHVILAATGTNKKNIINQILNTDDEKTLNYPVQKIFQKIEWHLDQDSAHLLPAKLHSTKDDYYDQNSGC